MDHLTKEDLDRLTKEDIYIEEDTISVTLTRKQFNELKLYIGDTIAEAQETYNKELENFYTPILKRFEEAEEEDFRNQVYEVFAWRFTGDLDDELEEIVKTKDVGRFIAYTTWVKSESEFVGKNLKDIGKILECLQEMVDSYYLMEDLDV